MARFTAYLSRQWAAAGRRGLMLLLLAGASPLKAAELGQPEPYLGELQSLAALNIRDARLETRVSGLKQPWAFEFVNDHQVLITERHGRLLIADVRSGVQTVVQGTPPVASDKEQTGLLDVALHPEFDQNGLVYLSYSAADPETGLYYRTEVAAGVLQGQRLSDVRKVLVADPIGWSPSNFGGALAFDAAGYLYVSVGDRSDRDVAQRGDRLQGKILRLNDDGSTPADNPFVGNPDVDDRVWALGVRNPQGLHFDPQSGLMFEAEHGPMGGDEVNVIERGLNYGWPHITYGLNYTTQTIGVGSHAAGMRQPLFYFLPSTAISPLTVYRGAMFPEWDGDVLVGALKARHINRLDIDHFDGSPGELAGTLQVRSSTAFLQEINPRVRDLKVAGDGSVWILEQAGKLHRLFRDPSVLPAAKTTGKGGIPPATVYAAVCAGCHDSGAYQSPLLNDAERWQAIRQQSLDEVYQRVLQGYGDMPARGLCDFCSDIDLRGAVEWMLQQSEPAAPES